MSKVSKCPVCGRTPLIMSITYTLGHKDHSISCTGPIDNHHPPVRSGTKGMKRAAVAAWESIVRDVKASNPANPVYPVEKKTEVANG